jgi:drug/metabolite transporter (DMT)-like permease
MTTAANAILLQYTAPIYVALLGAWLLKEKTKPRDWVAIALTLGGMALFFMEGLDMSGLLGNVFSLLSGVSFAFFAVFMRMQKDGSPLESVLLGNLLTAVIGLPFLFSGVPHRTGWLSLVLLGVFQLGLPYIFYAKAVKRLTALEVILIPVLEPILNPVWVFLMIGEVPGTLALVGGAIVLIVITAWCLLPSIRKGGSKTEPIDCAS